MNIQVKGQLIEVKYDLLVSKSVDIYEAHFSFDDAWDGFQKTAVFKMQNSQYELILVDDKCMIPTEVLAYKGYIQVGVYGTNDTKVYPTIWSELLKVQQGTTEGGIPTPPTPEVYSQILDELANRTTHQEVEEAVGEETERATAREDEIEASIPTVNNAKLTIKQNGTVKAEFTANSAEDVEVDLTGGGSGGTSNHDELDHRDYADSHPMSAITGLSDKLDEIEASIPSLDGYATEEYVDDADEILQTQISNLKNLGRFCAIWDASTGLPTSEPVETPYNYKVGDYFRIGVKGNKVPTGSTYVRGAYDTAEDDTGIGDVWYYDGVEWLKQASSGGGTVQDVQVNGTSILSGGVANIPLASSDTLGVIKLGGGLSVGSTGSAYIQKATDTNLVAKADTYKPVVSSNLDKAVMEGLGNNSLDWSNAYKSSAKSTIGISHETWSFTLEDGTTVNKEVALWT